MARNLYRHISRPSCSERASLGDGPTEAAIVRLKQVQQKAVTTMTNFHGSRRGVIDMLFNPDTIRRANDCRGIITPATNTIAYNVLEPAKVTLSVDFGGETTPAIQPEKMFLQQSFYDHMMPFMIEVERVHMQYEELKAVVRWLNRNATPGAIRYLFPQAMKLVPDSPIWKDLQQVPSRYSQPDDIAAWTQPIKDAANTFVAMALLPEEAKARTRERGMWLTFKPRKVHLDPVSDPNKMHYLTDDVIYNF